MKKLLKTVALLSLGAVAALTFAFKPDYFEISKQLDIFTSVFKEVNLYYVDETQPGELMDEAIGSMLSSLDPYTNYIPEEMVEDYKIQTTGNYGGIGAVVRQRDNVLILSTPYEGFAADKAGLQAGDVILEVNDKSVAGKSVDELSKVLKGAPGTGVKLKMERDGKSFEKTLERSDVQVKSVPYYGMLDDEIGYIILTSFTEKASREIKDALKILKKENELKGLVLDLRGNPGGLLSEAVNVTNIFIPKGEEVVQTKGKLEEWEKTYRTLSSPEDTETPVAVLINRGSASASEIVAGTLQDYDRAVVIGQRSFGKGLVQEQRELTYGAHLKVTIAKYYTPSGRCIQAINYAERAEDGSVAKLPDSLRTQFSTRGGRPVFDGGGIDPDIAMDETKPSDVVLALYRDFFLFDYATKFHRENPEIADSKSFALSDSQYSEFLKWLKTKEFDYKTETERTLAQLEEAAEKEGYFKDLKTEMAKLKSEYAEEEKADLEKHRAQIKHLLEEEIASRYYYDHGRVANSLAHDVEVKKAIESLKNKEEYQGILTAGAN